MHQKPINPPFMTHSRRSFLASSILSASALSATRVLGANEKIKVGMIGLGGRGTGSAKWFNGIDDVEIGYLCDVEQKNLDRAKQLYPTAKTTRDMRFVMEDKDIDAVVISTCNHWHVLAAIWACQAGKDVYVEKPISHNIWEGRQLVKFARKHDRIIQGGTQQRSDSLQTEIKEFLDTKELGAIKYVRCNRYGMRSSIGKRETPLEIPESCDYNMWLGPAQDLPIYREKFHYDWHWNFNTGNGELGNWGPHILDDLRNVVFRDKVKLPKRVIAGGGRFGWDDAGETPNTHFVYMDTGSYPVIMDVHNLPRGKGIKGGDIYQRRRTNSFLIIECENGYYAGGRGGGAAFDKDGKRIRRFKGSGGGEHANNFIKGMRNRNRAELAAEIEEIHYSSAWCHLGNISWRLGHHFERGEAEDKVKDFQPWKDVLNDFQGHLESNEIDSDQANIQLGVMLEIDAANETFVGPTATQPALDMLTRDYRRGFEIPKI